MSSKEDSSVTQKPLVCGLIMPISPLDGCSSEHWEEVRLIIKESLAGSDFKVELVSDSNEVGIIQKRIVQNIYHNEVVICDVSGKNPNVMFELGLRLAFDKPTIIIKDDKTNYSFDTAPIEHLEYPRDLHYQSIVEFKKVLKEKTLATHKASKKKDFTTFLKHFGEFKVAQIEEKEVSGGEFILESIKILSDSVSRLEKKFSSTNPTKQSSNSVSRKEVQELMVRVFKAFQEENGLLDPSDLYGHKDKLKDLVRISLMSSLGFSHVGAKNIMAKDFESQFDEFADIPF